MLVIQKHMAQIIFFDTDWIMKIKRKKFLWILGLIILLHLLVIIGDGLIDNYIDSDVIVIFGSKVELDGTPSDRLKSRLDKGYELLQNNNAKKIIVSGGLGKEGYEEATVMADYLKNKGIPNSSIIIDKQGYDTYKTAKNCKQIMSKSGYTSAILVSQYYHLSRSKIAFSKFGIENIGDAHAKMFPELRDVYSIPREVIGLYYYLFRKYWLVRKTDTIIKRSKQSNKTSIFR